MQEVPNHVLMLLLGLGIASLIVLARGASRLMERQTLIESTGLSPGQVSPVSAALAAAWIGVALLSAVTVASEHVAVPSVTGVRNSALMHVILFVAVCLPLLAEPSSETRHLGFRRDGLRQQLSDGVVGFLACLIPVGLVFAATLSMRSDRNGHALLRLLEADQSSDVVFWIFFSAVGVAPLVEELIYRVVLQSWLEHRLPPRAALLTAATVFSAVHRFPDALPLFPLAVVLGYLYQQRRSFLSVVVVHALFNTTNLAVLLLSLPPVD
ncbi:MAG: lysostaphin resistance A-like protein [Planctomycetota bacterium]|jgi:membrane protease YdiL (CAAX protease family)